MFEMTISTSKARSKDISFIISKLRPLLKSTKGVMVCEEYEGRVHLALAVNIDKKDFILGCVFDSIAEAIIRDYKEEYLKSKLEDKVQNSVSLMALVKVLTMFDKSSDKDIIKKHLEPSNEILIDSLYLFRLWELKKRWQEIVDLVIENAGYLLMSGTYLELIKFLILTNETEFGEVHLHLRQGNIVAETSDGREVFSLKYKEKDDKSKINVISELIGLSPERIILHSDIKDGDLSSFIVSLFDKKVCLLK